VLLRAFASGSTALTGVEAIANGVNAFRRPHGRNAATTLAVLGAISIAMFVGVSWLAVAMDAVPSADGTPSVLSQIARGVFPEGSASAPMYFAVQALTLGVLILAANTSYQGFPRLAALLARDKFVARQFTNLGDRLVYSNGVFVLTVVAGLLIWVYDARVDSLIHLYVIGVFTAFTLSQGGMVRYWLRTRDQGWWWRGAINLVGGATTGLVTVVVVWSKFAAGAWIVTVAIPALVLGFYGVRRHYRKIGRRLRAGTAAVQAAGVPRNRVLVYTDAADAAAEGALWYLHTVAHESARAFHVPGHGRDTGIAARWFRLADGRPWLEVLHPQGGDSRIDVVLEQVWGLPRGEADFVTVLLPERFRRASVADAITRSTFRLKLRLLAEPNVVVTDVPVVTEQSTPEGQTPGRLVVRVLVSDVNAASMRAVNYARSLDVEDTRAVFFAPTAADATRVAEQWAGADVAIPLDLTDAPYRDIGDPLLDYLRNLTGDDRTAVNVVMPELVLRGRARFLHNQRALYLKRLLLFERRVILSSVPYQLFR
jgi:hypothetical protein